MVWLSALWHVLDVLAAVGPAGIVVAAATLAMTVLSGRLPRDRDTHRSELRCTRRVLRESTSRAGVPRHRDPDAAGRSRPRAPSTAVPAA